MGIVGCYSIDVYCDDPKAGGTGERRPHTYNCTAWPGQFTGETEAECKREARRQGWKFGRGEGREGGGTAICPNHVRSRRAGGADDPA